MRWQVAAVTFLVASGCVPSYDADHIDGTDLQSRYPLALAEARRGWATYVAVALVLFTMWAAADLALRGTERRNQGGALLTAGALVGILLAAWLVTATAGAYPNGLSYRVAANAPMLVALVSFPAGIAWLVRGFHGGPGDRGEAVWGFYLVIVAAIMVPGLFVSSLALWSCTGSC